MLITLVIPQAQLALQAGTSWSGEFAVRRRDGSSFPALVTDSPVMDSTGRLIGIVGVSMDITERKAAEQALRAAHVDLESRVAARTQELAAANARLQEELTERARTELALAESERRFRAIFDSQFQFIGLLNPAGTLLEVNTTALSFSGLAHSDVVRRPFWEARWWAGMGPDTQAQLRAAITAAASGEFVRYEVDVRGVEEQVETIDFSLKPLRDERGEVVLLIPEGRVVSEQKRAALALRRSEQRYRSLVDAAPVGIFETDAAGACTFVNERWCEITGITSTAAMGSGWAQALHPDDRDAAFAHWQTFAAGQGDYHRVLRYQHADGQVRWTIADAVPLHDDDGSVIGSLGTVTDITERKQVEIQLSTSLQEKEILLREIHHRVKNNIQVVSSLLRMQRRRVTDSQVLAALSESQQRVAVMALVHELLYQSADLVSLDAQAYFTQLSDQLLRLYSPDPRRIVLQISGDGQHLSLDQAVPCGLLVHELLTNSFKYAFPDQREGEITVDLREVAPGTLRLEVADSGVGLPNPLPDTRSLGMRLIEGLVSQLQGHLVWSPGPGTCATVQFPSGITLSLPPHTLPGRTSP